MFENHGLGKHIKGDCCPKTPALWGFQLPDGGRSDASTGRSKERLFMRDDEVLQLTLNSYQLFVIFPARFCAILYLWLKILNREKSHSTNIVFFPYSSVTFMSRNPCSDIFYRITWYPARVSIWSTCSSQQFSSAIVITAISRFQIVRRFPSAVERYREASITLPIFFSCESSTRMR